MSANGWASSWPLSALRKLEIEPTPYAKKALVLWNKSTPTEPWTLNPLGIPAKGFATRAVPGTPYALFLKYSEFYAALAKALSSPGGVEIKVLLSTQESTVKLHRAISQLPWPAAETETAWPAEFQTWVGEEFSALLDPGKTVKNRSTGSRSEPHLNHEMVMQAQRRMITAMQTKQDLVKAIKFITIGPRGHGR